MKNIFFLSVGLCLLYSVNAFSSDLPTGEVSNENGTNPGVVINPGTVTNSDKVIHDSTSSEDGMGNAGNTKGIGTDHGGGNGPTN